MSMAHEPFKAYCRVYWGSHGCKLERGHSGDHICECCNCKNHPEQDPHNGGNGGWCVGAPPYYNIFPFNNATVFFGEDFVVEPTETVPLTPPGME